MVVGRRKQKIIWSMWRVAVSLRGVEKVEWIDPGSTGIDSEITKATNWAAEVRVKENGGDRKWEQRE